MNDRAQEINMSNVSVDCGNDISVASGCGGTGNGDGGGEVAGDSIDGEDQDESSSQHKSQNNSGDALANFREQWQRELEATSRQSKTPSRDASLNEDVSIENKAKNLFVKGVENEQAGKLYEAIQFYKKAVQLVPDIEFKLYESSKQRPTERNKVSENSLDVNESYNECDEEDDIYDDDDEEDADIIIRLQRHINKTRCVCFPSHEQKATHISELPMEIILYILRWVVSSELDLRSLEMCSEVCRGLYVCARDPEIWRLACVRVWGLNCGGLSTYGSWREMFICRPRLHFNGCYISKTTYLRNGENSFQDQFYRPWHIVEYYRYLRFFPEGQVLMLTTPDDPVSSLGHLKTRSPRLQATLVGHYRLRDERVTIVFHRQEALQVNKVRSRKQNNKTGQSFHLELKILTYKSRMHAQLIWTGYSVLSRNWSGQETNTSFELAPDRFPPFWFSRVKSYTSESEVPLM